MKYGIQNLVVMTVLLLLAPSLLEKFGFSCNAHIVNLAVSLVLLFQ